MWMMTDGQMLISGALAMLFGVAVGTALASLSMEKEYRKAAAEEAKRLAKEIGAALRTDVTA